MVESSAQGDGLNRPCIYARWRDDKEPSPGYSRELISTKTEKQFWDNHKGMPAYHAGCSTMLDYIEKKQQEGGADPFLGTRLQTGVDEKGKPVFGGYKWKTYNEVVEIAQALARGISKLGLSNQCEGDGRTFDFIGIWAKNRAEWMETHVANMFMNRTTIGFFDAMGPSSVDFILKQTDLACIFCTPDYVAKLTSMKKDGMATTITSLVTLDAVPDSQKEESAAVGIKVYDYKEVIEAGKISTEPFRRCTAEDYPIFSYTSGTTGDSKGVKLTHSNLLNSAQSILTVFDFTSEDILVSYLPYPHSFEQVMTAFVCIMGSRIGYYSGDPTRLTDDCQALKPTIFPSVPRLYNRIYGILKNKFNASGGCKTWLANRAVESKLHYLQQSASYTHGCYDKLVFRKVCDVLGGEVRMMISGSAPIDKQVLEFFKVCFCCPVLEGYGLTETSGGASVTFPDDPVAGHVGGPLPCVKWRIKDVPEMEYLSTDKPYPRGELQMMGATITDGYFKRPDKTREAFDSEGWFLTGDVVQVYPNGSVKIIDRSKNIFKLSQGEYIAPEKVENCFALCPYVAQSMVYGDSLKNCTVAIVVPEPTMLKGWADTNGMSGKSDADIIASEAFKKFLHDQLDQIGKANKLTSLERPRDIFLAVEPFSIENDILTPTFKLKRNIGRKVYQEQIDAMYVELAKKGF